MDLKKIILLPVFTFVFISCGDLFMKDEAGDSITINELATCQLNLDRFSFILEENIEDEINCLGANLRDFINIVETDRPGYVSKSVLKNFILNGPVEIDPESVDLVDTVFDLSYLIIGTDKEYIKNSDVDVLIDFLKYFNVNIIEAFEYFTTQEDVNYYQHQKERRVVYNKLSLIANKLKTIYKEDRVGLDRINTQEFVINFFKNKPETLERIRSLIFLKRLFLGGEKWDLTHIEFADALEILPELAQVALDLTKIDHYTFKDEQETLIKFFMRDIEVLRSVLFHEEDSQVAVFSIYDLIHAVKIMAADLIPFDIAKYPKEAMKIKGVLTGDSEEMFFAREIYTLLDHVYEIFSQGSFGFRVYDFFKTELNSPLPISHDLSTFPVSSSKEREYLDQFATVAANYKFFKGSSSSNFFTYDYRRNPNAFFEISTIEYVVKLIMSHYGQQNPNARGGYDVTLNQTLNMIKDFKWFLKDQGLVTIGKKYGKELEGVNDNFVLLSTLFQYQSDGCNETACLEAPEATEFIITMLTAISVKDFFTEKMKDFCAADLEPDGRIIPECFRRNFIKVLKEPIVDANGNYTDDGRTIADYMPGLTKYLDDLVADVPSDRPITESKDYMKFLFETEAFTRSCMYYDQDTKQEEVPLRVNDAFAVFAGLLNVESTVIRYDLDQNGKMDYRNKDNINEVMRAYYSTYEGAIKALVAPDGGFMELMAKPVFQYLIKYGVVPDKKNPSSLWKFFKFLLKRNKNADAQRVTIATVLKVIGEQSDIESPNPYKCDECFRDINKECLPADDAWND